MIIKNKTLLAIWMTKIAWLLAILFAFIFYISPINSELRLISHKLLVGCLAAIVAHVITKGFYSYLSLSTRLLAEDKKDELPDAIKFVAMAIGRFMFESAFVIGAMLAI